jgi:hypothetical protein
MSSYVEAKGKTMNTLEATKQRVADLEQQLYDLKEAYRQATEPLKQELSTQRQHVHDLKLQHKGEKVRQALAHRQATEQRRAKKTMTTETRELHNSVVFLRSCLTPLKEIAVIEGIPVEQVQTILKEEDLRQATKEIVASHERYIPDEVILKAYDITQQELNTILGRSDQSSNSTL